MATAKKTLDPIVEPKKPKLAAVPKPVTIGKAIDTLWQLREDKRALEAKVKVIEGQIAIEESIVFERLDAQETLVGKGTKASISIGSSTSFNIENFDLFAAFVKENNFFHLFQRRVSEASVREIFEEKGAVPGLTPFTKRKLNLRSL